MQPGGYALHLGWRERGPFYLPVAKRFGINFINVITPGVRQFGSKGAAEIGVVISELRRALSKLNVSLPASRHSPAKAHLARAVRRWELE